MKIYYWSPFFTNIATIKAVIKSAESLINFEKNKKYEVALIDAIGEWDLYKDNIKNEISIISDKDNIPKHDYHNHLLSLPGIFYKKNKSFPENKNFFQYDVEKLNKWKN